MPSFVEQQAAVMPGPGAENAVRDSSVHALLDDFVKAMQRLDHDAIQADFPAMTAREERILRSVRERLGADATLRVGSEQILQAEGGAVVRFVVLARRPDSQTELRLPFVATVRIQENGWRIAELH